MTEPRDRAPSTLLLVAGTGRSGTSTAAGTLARLGFVVPQPEVPADETNPRGFYEPQWVVDFHKEVLGAVSVRTNDARPEAVTLAAQAAAGTEAQRQLSEWLREWAAEPRVVIKDPRTFWVHDAWRRAAEDAGMALAFLTMLRHPAEVAMSRDQHYLAERDEDFRRARQTTNVAGWCHGMLVTERVTRSHRRVFVPYHDLVADWRATMRRADESLRVGLLDGVGEHDDPIGDFIDQRLNRSQVRWDDLAVHPEVRDLAEEIWVAIERLVEDPTDAGAEADLDRLHERYDRLYTMARDLTLDQTNVEQESNRKAQREIRERARTRVERQRQRVDQLQQRNHELETQLGSMMVVRLERWGRRWGGRVKRRLRRDQGSQAAR
jgi:hypothetical protein